MLKFGVGQSATRLEDQRLLTGHGTYTSDINLDGQVFGVCCAIATCARAVQRASIHRQQRAAPGVLAVYTADDIKAAGLKSIQFMTGLDNVDGSAGNFADTRHPGRRCGPACRPSGRLRCR